MRDLVVLGNRKLVFRAVRRWMSNPSRSDDMISDCQIVMIQSVAAFNPWLGIRFSTYAFTCLMRALSRMSQKNQGDRLAKSLPLETISDTEQASLSASEPGSRHQTRVDLYLKEDNTLLSEREKQVLIRRFRLDDRQKAGTLEQVGKELGLSKERVRQVQTTALDKLRMVLSALDGI
jgi:RNA polymerase primary sigma factor